MFRGESTLQLPLGVASGAPLSTAPNAGPFITPHASSPVPPPPPPAPQSISQVAVAGATPLYAPLPGPPPPPLHAIQFLPPAGVPLPGPVFYPLGALEPLELEGGDVTLLSRPGSNAMLSTNGSCLSPSPANSYFGPSPLHPQHYSPSQQQHPSQHHSPHSQDSMALNGGSKKFKLDKIMPHLAPPSRVVHIRNIPSHIPESDVVQLGLPFGKVSNILLLKSKNQAFLEFCDQGAAINMVQYYNINALPILGGRQVFIQFSQYKELKTDLSPQPVVNGEEKAASEAGSGGAEASVPVGEGGGDRKSAPPAPHEGHHASPVLRVIVEHMIYPITLDTLTHIFKKFGTILKLITFTKNNTFQALVQFDTQKNADAARVALNGQNVYTGCCSLKIDYSKLTSLNVKYNNEKSRDFTNPTLPSGEPGDPPFSLLNPAAAAMSAAGMLAPSPFAAAAAAAAAAANFPLNGGGGGGGGGGGIPHSAASPLPCVGAPLGPPMTPMTPLPGFPPTVAFPPAPGLPDILFSSAAAHSINVSAAPPTVTTTQILSPGGPLGAPLSMGLPALPALASPAQVAALTDLRALTASGALPVLAAGPVLLVSNLNEAIVSPENLFVLFGVYGDVVRVKVLFNKKDNALIQMSDQQQATIAMLHLDKLKLWGKQIRVTSSKHAQVQMPKEGQPDAGLTKDFSNSTLHRFKKPGSKNYSNIFPPSSTLHLSNIPPSATEEQITKPFEEIGTVKAFKFFPKDHKMALLQMETMEEAVESLIKMHNYQLAENSHLRVSFSKSTI